MKRAMVVVSKRRKKAVSALYRCLKGREDHAELVGIDAAPTVTRYGKARLAVRLNDSYLVHERPPLIIDLPLNGSCYSITAEMLAHLRSWRGNCQACERRAS